tara:strand:+ start:1125 stop:1640 length:516 start_codon:yes stop_codon:yes gene_type:complete
MALKIRLSRAGAKKRPYYHIVLADSRSPRDGRYIERLGNYNPMLPKDSGDRVNLKEERIKHWLDQGAQPSDRVARFLGKANIIEMPQHRDQPKKSKPKQKTLDRIAEREEKLKAAKEAIEQSEQSDTDNKDESAEAGSNESAEAGSNESAEQDHSKEKPAESTTPDNGEEN